MEILGSTSLPTGISKFVRDGMIIAFDDVVYPHAVIAKEANLGKPTGFFIVGMEEMKVDDAGAVDVQGGVLYFSSSSSSCELRGDPKEARLKTVEVATHLTGKPVKAQ